MNRSNKKVLICSNTAWSVKNFRSGLITRLLSLGFEVVVVAPPDNSSTYWSACGILFVPWNLSPGGRGVVGEVGAICELAEIVKQQAPNVMLTFTIKPNIYFSLLRTSRGIPHIVNISGLGDLRTGGVGNWLLGKMYKRTVKRAAMAFFQNKDDPTHFGFNPDVLPSNVSILPGSGVALNDLSHEELSRLRGGVKVRFLFASRLMWSKGLGDLVDAARLLKSKGVEFTLVVCGSVVGASAGSVPKGQIDAWQLEGLIEYLGHIDDLTREFMMADCVVLPSYYGEGVPRVLLEAGAYALPVITTDSTGCRDAAVDCVTGFLVEPRNSTKLAEAMGKIVSMPSAERSQMGARARAFVTKSFSEEIVLNRYVEAIKMKALIERGLV